MSKFNYFKIIPVDGYDFPTNPQANFGWISQGIALLNVGTNAGALNMIEYSFNGVDLHGRLDPANSSIGAIYDNRQECKIWFRATADGYSAVRVESWSNM